MTPPLFQARIREVVGPLKELLLIYSLVYQVSFKERMLLHLIVVAAGFWSSQARPADAPQSAKTDQGRQFVYVPERQQYSPEIQYDLSLLGPQLPFPTYNFIDDKQTFPRVQPQIIFYGGAPGQPFLLQPGSPPGNFLVPQVPQIPQQPGPNILRHTPQRPVFVAGYPKPAHIPPIEKDAEEVPTNIPPKENKPEKLETFNEDTIPKKTATETEVLAAADRNPAFNPRPNLRPGQRFFILNGQPIFTNYPYGSQLYPNINLKYAQPASPAFLPHQAQPSEDKNISPFQNLFRSNLEDVPTPRIAGTNLQPFPENLILLNQPGGFQDNFLFKPSANLAQRKETEKQQEKGEFRIDAGAFGLDDQDNEAVVIDARQQDESSNSETDSEVVSAAEKPGEPTISQAQPGAIALAGPGGVAAAAPRGTAFVGKEGIAVSSPQATAVAGPTRDEIQQPESQTQKSQKQTNKRKQ